MRGRSATFVAAAALGLFAAGCGENDKCPTESPQVSSLAANCEAIAGTTVNYPLRLCPTCNQTISSCDVQMSGFDIFLNPTVEVCSSSSSCPPACQISQSSCAFRAPNGTPGTDFTVSVFDPGTNAVKTGTLTIVSASPTCAL